MSQQQEFSGIQFPVRGGPQATGPSEAQYKIYTSATEFTSVQAASAAEALKASGVSAPYRIKREITSVKVVIEQNDLLG